MNEPGLVHDDRTGLVSGAIQFESPNFDARPAKVAIDVLVIHAISLPPDCFGGNYVQAFFTNRLDIAADPFFEEIAGLRVSSHFYIDRKGDLFQFVSTRNRAWHAGASSFRNRERVNDFSIGVELEGCDALPFEAIQYRSLSALTRCLQNSFPEITEQNIVGHSDIAPGRKTDPGPCFDWQRYRGLLRSRK